MAISLKLPDELLEASTRVAEALGVSRTEYIRQATSEALGHAESRESPVEAVTELTVPPLELPSPSDTAADRLLGQGLLPSRWPRNESAFSQTRPAQGDGRGTRRLRWRA